MKKPQNRKLINLFLDSAALSRLSLPFLLMSVASIAIVTLIRWKVLEGLKQIELVGSENLPAINALLALQENTTSIGTTGVLVLTAMCFILWILHSHRIFGPTVAIKKHIERLIAHDYSSRIQLRQTDEFKDLAEDLNRLAETLEKKSKTS